MKMPIYVYIYTWSRKFNRYKVTTIYYVQKLWLGKIVFLNFFITQPTNFVLLKLRLLYQYVCRHQSYTVPFRYITSHRCETLITLFTHDCR